MKHRIGILGLCLTIVAFNVGCTDYDCLDGECTNADYGVGPQYSVTKAALTAQCSISVEGYGAVDIETDYIPNVTWCENGRSSDAGLRAQAVAARTFAYYKISRNATPVTSSQNDQVYYCKSWATRTEEQFQRCIDATNETAGEIMTYHDTITAGFYVAGVTTDYLDSNCKFTGGSGSTGWVSNHKYVTYNEGKSGDDITQSSIGSLSKTNYANRGCMSQNGATCLGDKGYTYDRILRFFYGEDINIETGEGECVTPKKCETVLDKSGVIIDEKDPCFSRTSASSWYSIDGGYDGHLYYTYVWDKSAQNIGTWNINVTRPGTYEIFAYIEKDIGAMSENAPYVVRASGVEHQISVNLALKSGWVSIGKFTFASGGDQWVKLSDASGEKYTGKDGKRIVFDALKFVDSAGCSDNCVENSKQCLNNGFQICNRNTSTGCTEWSAATDCGSQTCKNGACASDESCTDEADCDSIGKRRCSGNGYQTCGNFDDDSCLEWSEVMACDNDGTCSGSGICSQTSCSDDCQPADAKCQGSGYILCGNFDGDPCLEWSTSEIACNTDEQCQGGRCVKQQSSGEQSGDSWTGETGEMPSTCMTQVDGRESTIIDDLDDCFVRSKSSAWSELVGYGHSSHIYYSYVKNSPSAVGTWYLNVTKSGRYSIYAYIENGVGKVSSMIPYTVHSANGSEEFIIDVADRSGWFYIGTYTLGEGLNQYVQLKDAFSSAGEDNEGKRLLYDAIQIVPAGTKVVDAVTGEDTESQDPSGNPTYSKPSNSSDCSAQPLSSSSNGMFAFLLGLLGVGVMTRRRRSM